MKKCPTCGHSYNHAAQSNTGTMTQISVPSHLLPALADGIAIARNTAFMSRGKDTIPSFESLREEVNANIPAVAKLFSRYEWFALCDRVKTGANFVIKLADNGRPWAPEYWIEIHDTGGNNWPHYLDNSSPLRSAEMRDKEQVEADLASLREEITRYQPLS
jgi:hypothetical protein